MAKIMVYTREAEGIYTQAMANSVHMAYSRDASKEDASKEDASKEDASKEADKKYEPLNNNYGILFAEAEISDDNLIVEKGLTKPALSYDDELGYCITAIRTDADGNPDAGSSAGILLWTTNDFISFEYKGLVDGKSFPKGNFPKGKNEIDIPDEYGKRILKRWRDECGRKPAAEKYVFPLAKGYADPDIIFWNGRYYFMATNDNTDSIGLFIRSGNTVSELFKEDAKEYKILDRDYEKGFISTFWAPEMHVIGDDLYILFAVGGSEFGPRCHMMRLKYNGNPLNRDDWECPVKVVTKNGEDLCAKGITLDMTYLKVNQNSYLVWSARIGIGGAGDTGSMLYIAPIDDNFPTRLTGEPVLLSRPLFGWENTSGTINNEGPYGIVLNGTVYLFYSGGAAGGDSYAVGCLSIPEDGDLLNPAEWKKEPSPVLSSYSVEGVYGPGHNSITRDEDGDLLILYHAQEKAGRAERCVAISKICFDEAGKPYIMQK